MRVLVIQGDDERRESLALLLSDAGHEVEASRVPNGVEEQVLGGEIDLVILDKPPGTDDRLELMKQLRALSPALPLLVLTADGLVEERVLALEAGADDCLSESYAPSQMRARVSALARRAQLVPAKPEIVESDGCFFDLGRSRAVRGKAPIDLTARECAIIRWLHRHRARAVTRPELLEHVFGVSPRAETRSVDMAIVVLRKKIERDPSDPKIIRSVKGVGYAWGVIEDLTHS